MTPAEIISGSLGFLSMIAAIVGLYVKGREESALAKQQSIFQQRQIDELKNQVNSLEKNVFERIEVVHDDIVEIKVSLAKLVNK